jgi:hypothetical protein
LVEGQRGSGAAGQRGWGHKTPAQCGPLRVPKRAPPFCSLQPIAVDFACTATQLTPAQSRPTPRCYFWSPQSAVRSVERPRHLQASCIFSKLTQSATHPPPLTFDPTRRDLRPRLCRALWPPQQSKCNPKAPPGQSSKVSPLRPLRHCVASAQPSPPYGWLQVRNRDRSSGNMLLAHS